MKIGIVGGSGFIGSHLTSHLGRVFSVKVLDVKPASVAPWKSVSFECCDVRRYDDLCDSLSDIDLVIHAAVIQIPQINENKRLAYEVNIVGTQNVCKAVDELPTIRGMILTSSWHTIGERELTGVVNEEFGFRPDKVEDRARLYALSKMVQESIVRFHSEMSEKFYGIIRMGTVLGEGMPEKTAANIFIEKGLKGEALTPFKHSMFRPMLYVDIEDVCQSYEVFANKIFDKKLSKSKNSLHQIANLYYPQPITILELAEAVRNSIVRQTNGNIRPPISVIDNGIPATFFEDDKNKVTVDIRKAKSLLGISSLVSPQESIDKIIRERLKRA